MKEIGVHSKPAVLIIVTAIILIEFFLQCMAQTTAAAEIHKISKKPLVIGHRGAAGIRPENTLAAFRRACEIGVDAIELDVLISGDDELVVHHDYMLRPEIARSADGNWIAPGMNLIVKDLSLAQIKSYDVGRLQPYTSYATKYPEQVPVDGERIPTFKETIDLFKKTCSPSTRLFVEIKTSPEQPDLTPPPEQVAEKVVKVLRDEGLVERAWVLSFDWRNLVHVQKIAPEITTVYLTIDLPKFNTLKINQPGGSPWLAGLDIDNFKGSVPQAIKAAGGRIWSPYYRNLTLESLAEAHQLGLLVSVWTPDTTYQLEKLIEMGVDAITTNRPDLLKQILTDK